MKLIIQIPCFNEEETLPLTINDLPKSIPGIDIIETMVVDDGSSDRTVEIAKSLNVDHIVSLGTNRGLAFAFKAGVDRALELDTDFLVNTDGDNQYVGEDIAKLIQPLVENKAEMVVGARPILNHPEFSFTKRLLQRFGSHLLRIISKTDVRDAASGFRAFSRNCLLRVHLHSSFSYCMETLIQAGNTGQRVASVDIRINSKTRDSRLFKSIPQYVYRQGLTILNMFLLYRPFTFFTLISLVFLGISSGLGFRYFYLTRMVENRISPSLFTTSLTVLAISSIFSILLFIFGLIGELLRTQRSLTEEVLYHERLKNQISER